MFKFLSGRWTTPQICPLEQVVRDIAERSVATTRERMHSNVSRMSVSELRGYVRARAIRPVYEQAKEVLGKQGIQVSLRDPLVTRSLERTVHLVVRQLMMRPAAAYAPVRRVA